MHSKYYVPAGSATAPYTVDVTPESAGWTESSLRVVELDSLQEITLETDDTEVMMLPLAGGLVFAYWKREVREFLIDNARFFLSWYHADGFRLDEVTVIDRNGGWSFLQDVTSTVRYVRPGALQKAEYWNVNPLVVKPVGGGGAGCWATLFAPSCS